MVKDYFNETFIIGIKPKKGGKMSKKRLDLCGARFGRLVVLSDCGNDSRGHSEWLCQCDCGNQYKVRGSNIAGGQTSSCGCLKAESAVAARVDITGSRFGWLVALEDMGTTANNGRAEWLCECGCGKRIITNAGYLQDGQVTSCGCRRVKRLKSLHLKKYEK